jgi:ABC-type glycerol-3-phosphate transport system substrate-binding protein
MLKRYFYLLMLVLVLTAIVGCSSDENQTNTENNEGNTKLTLTAISGEVTENLNNHANSFMDENPDIEIEIVEYPEQQYKDQARSLFTSSEKPDLAWFWAEDNYFQMAEVGVFEPLDELYEENGWNEALPESTLNLFTSSDGSKYAVNTDVVWTPVLYYNKAIFEEVGLEPPSTLEELYEIADQLKSADYIPLSTGAGEGYVTGHLFNMLLSRLVTPEEYNQMLSVGTDPDAINFDDSQVTAVWSEMEKMRGQLFPEGVAGISDNEARSLFIQEQAAMYSQGSWAAGDANLGSELPDDFELGYVFYPQIQSDIPSTVGLGVGNSLMILEGTENKEAAENFITHVMSVESQKETARTIGFFPSRTDVDIMEIEDINEMLADQYQQMQEIGSHSLLSDVLPSRLQSKLFEVNQAVLTGTADPKTAGMEMEAVKGD